jgi:predicted ATPase/class 3 adenylate cyclase/DNA-binding CsgD family transcriptional regulator
MSDTGGRSVGPPLHWGDVMHDEATASSSGFALPTGTVTFLMTDVEGSTRGWERSAVEMAGAVAHHYEILDRAVGTHRGVRPVEQGEGDSVVAAFSRASDAVAAAFDAQRAFACEDWPTGVVLRVRMALHTGEAQLRDESNYFGPVVIRCARIRNVGHGGQVLVSDSTAALVAGRLPAGATLEDLGVVRLKDLGRPERVRQLVHDELERAFPPLRGLDSYRQNLPARTTPLIGRRDDIAAVVALLETERLVTLTGAGGVGKTRLALAVGAERVEQHPGGVWFVDLAGSTGPDTAARAVLRVLRAVEAPTMELARQVAVELADAGPTLVILDNCEHTLDDAAAFVATVLGGDPTVSVLATSREPLGVGGEVAWRVPSLPTPDSQQPVAIEALSQCDAVALFIDRARRAHPSFRVTDANAPAVAQICQRLDGIPLAIELAAARLRHLTAERIAEALDDRFRLLVGGPRVVLPRQQTLAASVAWSHDLLSPDEQLVLRRLGVFAGRFELDAAEQVVAALGDIDAVHVFDVLSRLVDKSLLVADEHGHEVLYRMLQTIRAFALARCGDANELDRLRDAHLAWWHRRLTGLGVTGPTDEVVALVEAHHDDLVAALNRATDRDLSMALDVGWPLARAFQGAGSAGAVLPAIERLLGPEIERTDPRRWLRTAISATIVILNFRGLAPFVDLVRRCEHVALDLDDPIYLALARWVVNMNVDTSRRILEVADRHQHPYARALATVRFAIDAGDQAPDELDNAIREARRVADEYGSQYIREYAAAAGAHRAATYGDLRTALWIGAELATARTPAMRRHAYEALLAGGLAVGDQAALRTAVALAEHDLRRGVVTAQRELDWARSALTLVQDRDTSRLRLELEYHPLIACRDAVDRGDIRADRAELAGLTPVSVVRHAYRHLLDGLIDGNEDAWHAALDIALQYDVRPVAVDAFEGLAVIAASTDSPVEAMRLFGAADRLMDETGYRWRFPSERQRHDDAAARAQADLGDEADVAWAEGRALNWRDAAEYARRARGERKRPRHGWDSLTPTEVKVVNLAAQGHSNPEIAERLLMSRSTVKTHLEHVFTKTGNRNRAELTAEVVRRQAAQPPT